MMQMFQSSFAHFWKLYADLSFQRCCDVYSGSSVNVIQTAFTRYRHILKTVKNVTDRPPVHTKTAHFCRQISKTVDFENGTLTGTFWKRHRVNTQKMIKKNIFQCFWNETDRFLECRYISLASKSCNELFTCKFSTVFKLFRYRVNASSNFATVTFFTVFKMCRHRVNAVSFSIY